MEILIFSLFLLFLNIFVVKFYGTTASRWITSGLIVMLLCSPLVFFITLYIIGTQTGDGFAGGMVGLAFGIATFMNGSIFLIKGLLTRKNQSAR
jgi:hypothetical protein